MKKLNIVIVSIISVLAMYSCGSAQKTADKDTKAWNYEIECEGTGVQGSYIVKVWSYSEEPEVAIEQAKKNAVHGIIFKGYTSVNSGCTSQKPLASNLSIEDNNKDFFKSFFADGGMYMKFISLSTDGNVDSGDVLKMGKKKYKIGVVVSVQKDELRKYLESKGIIKGLSSGF